MLHFKSIMRATGWLAIGILFGLASICILFFASQFFNHDFEDPHKISLSEAAIFLFLALKSGAGADFLFSEIANWGARISLMFVVVFALLFVGYVFNPNNHYTLSDDKMKTIAIYYSIFSILYCLILKSVIFYRERIANAQVKDLNYKLSQIQQSKSKRKK